jgi:hypothetical protein
MTMPEIADTFSRVIWRQIDSLQMPWDQAEEQMGEAYTDRRPEREASRSRLPRAVPPPQQLGERRVYFRWLTCVRSPGTAYSCTIGV